jgi:hypothetical protein
MPVQPSQKEEEYFARVELEKRKKLQEERLKTLAEEEKRRLRDFHGMGLREINHRGINVDRCFSCDGLWLDAGELDVLAKLDRPALDKLFSAFKR